MQGPLFPFEILEVPASGSYATLCVAKAANGQVVACKVLKKGLVDNAEALTRMRDEARMLSRLDHPCIVSVHDLLNLDGRPVMVMEWVEGMDLSRLLRAHPDGLPAGIACEIVRQVALGLNAAYTSPVGDPPKPLQVIHRDIKPDNVLLSTDGKVKVLDFGTAKGAFDDREAMTTAMVMGSRGFMPPERMELLPDTVGVDVYALGITWLMLLTGKMATISRAEHRHDAAVEKAVGYIKTEDLLPNTVIWLRDLIRRMCSYEPEERPTYDAIIEDIEGFLKSCDVDLEAFAAAHVLPASEARTRLPPEKHPDFPDLAFLGTAGSWETLDNPGITQQMSDDAVRRALRESGWEERVPELQVVLANAGRWTAGPFIDILRGHSTPWWKVWASRPSPTAIATALDFLKQRKSQAQVRSIAETFVDHKDPRIHTAAKAILSDD